MPDKSKKFHHLALQSSLFKGHSDWYFCYLKSEKIAHVLYLLAQRSNEKEALKDTLEEVSQLPSSFAHFAAGEVSSTAVLAHLFSLISYLRLAGTQHALSPENVSVFVQEVEQLVERISLHSQPSPFVAVEDLSVPLLEAEATPLVIPKSIAPIIKDISQGQYKGHLNNDDYKGQNDRSEQILRIIRSSSRAVSIKDISSQVKEVSEKTIQRELGVLIDRGLIKKEGERRWSVYRMA
ncbi:hypothetical protein KW798_02955 [Candidatus Parcubacteria bacterium]|nr:hypothetical protein [Candidatus Parcubacteria bacterium]